MYPNHPSLEVPKSTPFARTDLNGNINILEGGKNSDITITRSKCNFRR